MKITHPNNWRQLREGDELNDSANNAPADCLCLSKNALENCYQTSTVIIQRVGLMTLSTLETSGA